MPKCPPSPFILPTIDRVLGPGYFYAGRTAKKRGGHHKQDKKVAIMAAEGNGGSVKETMIFKSF